MFNAVNELINMFVKTYLEGESKVMQNAIAIH